MSGLKFFAMIVALILLQACETPDQYPVSGEECGPEDPVKELDASNCLPPAGL